MNTTAQIFRKHNFLLLDKILNNGDYTIEANGFTDPNNEIFNQPINKFKNDRNSSNGKINRERRQVDSQRSCCSKQS